MSDQVSLGFWCEVFGLLYIFYIDPLVMSVPAIETQNGIAIPVHASVQENRSLTFLALAMDL
tara:strand:- start:1948 stop:2133 length:186 start_codon:yes stop_codon:yes gene_type:complete